MTDTEQKQIDTMAKDLCEAEFWEFCEESNDLELNREETAKSLYDIGYRKRSVGKWVKERLGNTRKCGVCGNISTFKSKYCPECGSIMEDEE